MDIVDTTLGYSSHVPATGNYNLVDESDTLLGRIFTLTAHGTNFFEMHFVHSNTDSFNLDIDSLSHFSGVSAHDYHRKTLDYYHSKFGREGWFYPGSRILSAVDYGPGGDISEHNAYYSNWSKSVNYGIGGGIERPYSVAIDVDHFAA